MIDIQTHYVPPQALRLLAALAEKPAGLGPIPRAHAPILGLEHRLRQMDANGIETSLLGFAPIGMIGEPGARGAIMSAANDGLLDACRCYPGRFVMSTALPLPDLEAAIEELSRIMTEPALRAIQVIAQTTDYTPEHFEPLFAAAAKAGLPVILHPAAGVSDLSPHFDAYGLGSGMHAMVSHSLVAARMIQSGMLDRLPTLDLIVTHLGGILTFLVDRLDSRHRGTTRLPPSYYLKHRLFFDNCGFPAGPALRCAIETLGAGRIMIGSDWPSRRIETALNAIMDLDLDEAATTALLHRNARRWFDPASRRAAQ